MRQSPWLGEPPNQRGNAAAIGRLFPVPFHKLGLGHARPQPAPVRSPHGPAANPTWHAARARQTFDGIITLAAHASRLADSTGTARYTAPSPQRARGDRSAPQRTAMLWGSAFVVMHHRVEKGELERGDAAGDLNRRVRRDLADLRLHERAESGVGQRRVRIDVPDIGFDAKVEQAGDERETPRLGRDHDVES
jgi:hypothetical protein